jgi:hypothetical protein
MIPLKINNFNHMKLKELPLVVDVETKAVLKSLPSAHAALAD